MSQQLGLILNLEKRYSDALMAVVSSMAETAKIFDIKGKEE